MVNVFAQLLSVSLALASTSGVIDSKVIFEKTKAASVVIITGGGTGRLRTMASGVVVSKDGVILTAYHVIKGADEVQVRLPNGDVFDHVELLGVDERRDIAALRIPAGSLPGLAIGNSANLAQGDAVYAVTNSGGWTWSATEGIISSLRDPDDVPGADSGFRLLQFTAPVGRGSSGGALVDGAGNLIGIITSGSPSAGFAVPIDSVIGLTRTSQATTLGSGRLLRMPAKVARETADSSAEIAGLDHQKLLQDARTIHIESNTAFITFDTLSRALTVQKDWPKTGLTLVQDQRVADLFLRVDRVIFTHVHTYSLIDRKTSIVLASGRIRAFDGILASKGIAGEVVKIFSDRGKK